MSVPVSPDVAKLVRFWLKIKVFGNIFRVIRHLAKFEPILAIIMPLYLQKITTYYANYFTTYWSNFLCSM